VSLTHRARARRLQYVTGHGADGQLPADIDWQSIADPGATTIVYMPAKTLAAFSATAIARGINAATPAVAVINATRADEAVVAATIADLPTRLAATAIAGPAVVMIGQVFDRVAERVAAAQETVEEDGDATVVHQAAR
jgi:uroporphyrin-III C-methyltransferase/precorrin-2 dehydrogenase/sirohydrochlorin ferrochelatase